jgi:hypothetical protein
MLSVLGVAAAGEARADGPAACSAQVDLLGFSDALNKQRFAGTRRSRPGPLCGSTRAVRIELAS